MEHSEQPRSLHGRMVLNRCHRWTAVLHPYANLPHMASAKRSRQLDKPAQLAGYWIYLFRHFPLDEGRQLRLVEPGATRELDLLRALSTPRAKQVILFPSYVNRLHISGGITPVIPGVNIPWSHLPLFMFVLVIAGAVHEVRGATRLENIPPSV
jgi:hypothetical protein